MVRKTPISDPIASEEFIWVTADGTRSPIEAKVGRPYLVGATEWACPCEIEGLDGAYPDVSGEGSLQALCLGLGLIRKRLVHLVESGGRLLDPQGNAVDDDRLAVLFGRRGGFQDQTRRRTWNCSGRPPFLVSLARVIGAEWQVVRRIRRTSVYGVH
jgi:hypothetical protein